MTRHDILTLAVDADLVDVLDLINNPCNLSDDYISSIERFAALVAAHERESCAKVCEEQYEYYGHDHIFAAKIRARGQS